MLCAYVHYIESLKYISAHTGSRLNHQGFMSVVPDASVLNSYLEVLKCPPGRLDLSMMIGMPCRVPRSGC